MEFSGTTGVRELMRRNGWRLFAGAAVAVILAGQPAMADDADTCTMASRRDLAIAGVHAVDRFGQIQRPWPPHHLPPTPPPFGPQRGPRPRHPPPRPNAPVPID